MFSCFEKMKSQASGILFRAHFGVIINNKYEKLEWHAKEQKDSVS